ncbi:MalY/PatB family protein [Ketogulonicigenium vulgare]|uniref:cysteine-S-conjugate beta-lyase n=1 Tax=Ketogulonicigenium vulgare (strain WSH-001) TaxID=759362 RepID=F9Y7X3_KETVW|nr:PatB family C-S lyase [Ketogulonicigenium vulgare]ADO42912.1 aspartate/tyrosine/aromatic aminotransferase protein [Ketogulonicigenium vulgare Y25]AEM41099.1 Aspartate/tyrosine/aromatic aminotransferase protein [Ketogulonicigenium vulgare WSH-001]ALJ81239.1 amino acid aminotransferase [Ketogulonicigenium vulgare]ANW33981.1 amino acid aminotransferase [Ketogulonicigenium vulgare]AOZ54822.1 aspartate/tyrosine/aromatic aminotransferase protein [Ketogulonicigenium vulgare]
MDTQMTMTAAAFEADFAYDRPALLARRNAKWRQYDPDVIPAFVADMDFRVAPAIQAAIRASVDAEDYGYPMRDGKKADRAVLEAFAHRMKGLYGWEAQADLSMAIADLVQATFASVMAFTQPGDGVIVQVPNYPPFRAAVNDTGRSFVPMPMKPEGDGYVFDLDQLAATMPPSTRMLILCNPQNPTGRVFSRAELQAVLAFAQKHDLLVLSDEIHSDLIYAGNTHLPFAALGPAAEARTITLNSATKSFNIPGLRTAVINFGTEALKARFERHFPARVVGSVNSLGIDATVAAWQDSSDWLCGLIAHLSAMRDHVYTRITRDIPMIRMKKPEATYLTWLDCSDLGLSGTAFDFFHTHARIGFSPGENFLPGAERLVRLNFATSRVIIDEMIDRMAEAVQRNTR